MGRTQKDYGNERKRNKKKINRRENRNYTCYVRKGAQGLTSPTVKFSTSETMVNMKIYNDKEQ